MKRLSSLRSGRKSSPGNSPTERKSTAPDAKIPDDAVQEADITYNIPYEKAEDAATATITLHLQKKNGRLGISIDDDNFVHDVDEGSAGQDAGFCIGDWVSCRQPFHSQIRGTSEPCPGLSLITYLKL